MRKPKILVIDDQWGIPEDPMITELYGNLPFTFLQETGREENAEYTPRAALASVKREMPELQVVLLDILFGKRMDMTGIEMLAAIRAAYPVLPVLMLTSLVSDENREVVVRCMELGANEYVEKAPDAKRMRETLDAYTDPNADLALYGNTQPVRQLRAEIARVAFSGEVSMLVVGESGTGKELIARALHRQGPKKFGRFVAKNCAHSDLQLLDSELFGHEKGAFTGATEQRIGLIEEADKGVLFLDEISDMPAELQAKLLRVLETRTFRRLGRNGDLRSDFKLICATNRDPAQLIKDGKLRQDLFYRISTMTLHAPPLREHREDITVYADLFTKKFKARGGGSYPGEAFSEVALERLSRHAWPGNVRELRNVVERAIILAKTREIGVDCLPPEIAGAITPITASSLPNTPSTRSGSMLPAEPVAWPRERLLAEIRLCLAAKQRIQVYKGNQWKAELMRLMYPECKAANAKGFDDLVRRLTKGPWGDPTWAKDEQLRILIEQLNS